VVAVLAAAFAVVTARVLIWPSSGMPARVDAIVMMAGPGDRLPVATMLAGEHRAPVLIVSQGQHGYGGPCPRPITGVTIICFDPVPGDTRGEAEFAGHLARLYGWHSIALVTSSEQATRAGIIMRRCYPGPVYVVSTPVALGQVPYEVAYGWAALVKALVLNHCLSLRCVQPPFVHATKVVPDASGISRDSAHDGAYGVRRSGSGVRRSGSGLRRSASGLRRSASGLRRSASGLRRSASGLRHSGGGPAGGQLAGARQKMGVRRSG
jgi:hypothetical protein